MSGKNNLGAIFIYFWIVKLRDKIDNKVALVQYYVDATKAQVDQYLKDYWSGEKPVVLDAFNNAEEAEKRVQDGTKVVIQR